jgi:beta-glucanase (GH16 family)
MRRLENSRVTGGSLVITARREALSDMPDWGNQQYSSARLLTRGKAQWTYGFFEIRAKLPCGMGTWPAIWTLGHARRLAGRRRDRHHGAAGWPEPAPDHRHRAHDPAVQRRRRPERRDTRRRTPAILFHNYQVEWTSTRSPGASTTLPSTPYRKSTTNAVRSWPFDDPQYMLLNVAVGGVLGGTPDDTKFPARMEVDYVRVYKP